MLARRSPPGAARWPITASPGSSAVGATTGLQVAATVGQDPGSACTPGDLSGGQVLMHRGDRTTSDARLALAHAAGPRRGTASWAGAAPAWRRVPTAGLNLTSIDAVAAYLRHGRLAVRNGSRRTTRPRCTGTARPGRAAPAAVGHQVQRERRGADPAADFGAADVWLFTLGQQGLSPQMPLRRPSSTASPGSSASSRRSRTRSPRSPATTSGRLGTPGNLRRPGPHCTGTGPLEHARAAHAAGPARGTARSSAHRLRAARRTCGWSSTSRKTRAPPGPHPWSTGTGRPGSRSRCTTGPAAWTPRPATAAVASG